MSAGLPRALVRALWAHRGGGGNFGVVTSLELRLHELGPMVFGGLCAYAPEHGETLARALRDFSDGGPDEAGVALAQRRRHPPRRPRCGLGRASLLRLGGRGARCRAHRLGA